MALIDDIRKQYPDATSGKTDLDVASDFAKANGWSLEQTAYKMGVELPNDPGFLTTVKRSGAQFAGGIGEVYGDVTGNRDNALSSWADNVAARNPSGINSLQDIADNPWLAAKEAVGNAATFVVPGGALKLGANALRGAKAVNAARMLDNPLTQAAVAGVPSLQEIGDSQRESGLGENRGLKYLGAGAVGAIENLGGVQRVLGYGGQNTARTIAQEVADFGKTPWRTVGKTMLRQGAEEGAEELVQTPIEQLAGYKNPTDARNLEETALGGAMGAIGGGVFGGGFGVQRGLKHRKIEQFRQADLLQPDTPLDTLDNQAEWNRAFIARDQGQAAGDLFYNGQQATIDNYIESMVDPARRRQFAADMEAIQARADQERIAALAPSKTELLPGIDPRDAVLENSIGLRPSWQEQQRWWENVPDPVNRDAYHQFWQHVAPTTERMADSYGGTPDMFGGDTNYAWHGAASDVDLSQPTVRNRRQGELNFDAPALPPVMFGNQGQPYSESFNNSREGKFDKELNTKAQPSSMTGVFSQLPVGDSASVHALIPESQRLNETVSRPQFPMPTDVGSAVATINQARSQGTPIIEGSEQHVALVRAAEILRAAGVKLNDATKPKQVATKAPQANAAQAGTQQAAAPAGKVTVLSGKGKKVTAFAERLTAAVSGGRVAPDDQLIHDWNASKKTAADAHSFSMALDEKLSGENVAPLSAEQALVDGAKNMTAKQKAVFDYLQAAFSEGRADDVISADGTWRYADIGKQLGMARGQVEAFVRGLGKAISAADAKQPSALSKTKNSVTEVSLEDRLGMSPAQQDSLVDIESLIGSENGAEASLSTINSIGGSVAGIDADMSDLPTTENKNAGERERADAKAFANRNFSISMEEKRLARRRDAEVAFSAMRDDKAIVGEVEQAIENEFGVEYVATARDEWNSYAHKEILDGADVPAFDDLSYRGKKQVVRRMISWRDTPEAKRSTLDLYGSFDNILEAEPIGKDKNDFEIGSLGAQPGREALGVATGRSQANDGGAVEGQPEAAGNRGQARGTPQRVESQPNSSPDASGTGRSLGDAQGDESRSEERQGQPVTDEATGRGDSTAEDQPAARDGGDAESTQSAELTPARIEAEWNRAANALNLPAFSGLTDEQQDYLHSSADMAEFNEAANEVAAEVAAELASVEAQPEFSESGRHGEPAVAGAVEAKLRALFFSPTKFSSLVTVVQTAAELPSEVRGQLSQAHDADTVQGFTYGGKVYLIAGNIRQGKELSVFLHEVGVHLGMDALIGKANVARLVSTIRAWAADVDNKSLEAQLARAAVARANKSSSSDTDEEVLAYFVEKAVDSGVNPSALPGGRLAKLLSEFVAALKVALRKIGLGNLDSLSAKNIVDLAYGAANLALSGETSASSTEVKFSEAVGAFSKVGQVVDELLAGRTGALKEFKLGWLTLEQIVEGSKNLGEKVTTALANYSATMTRMQQTSKDIVYRAALIDQKWNDLSKSSAERLSKIMQDATLESFDPATQEPTTDKQRSIKAAYAALTSQGKEGAAAKAIYQESRDFFESLWHKRAALMRDAAVKAKLGGKELSEIDAMYGKRKGPYFPLVRTGKYYAVGMSQQVADLVEKKDRGELTSSESTLLDKLRKDPNHYITEAFASEREALVRSREYEAKMGVGYSNLQAAKLNMSAVQIPGFAQMEAYLKDSVEDAGIREDLSNMFAQMMFDMAGEHSALKRAMKREGVAGANPDMRQAIATTAQSQAHYIGRLENSTQMAADLMDIKNLSDKGNADVRRVYNELIERTKLSYQMDPENKLVDHLTSASYFAHLGISPAFWLTNMTQVPMITAPWLGARYGFGKVPTALATAFVDAKAIIKTSIIDGSWQNELDWSQRFAAGSNEDKLFRTLLDRGILDVTMEHDLGAVARTGNPVGSVGARFEQMKKMANTPVRVTEYANRAITALAAYRLEMAKSNNHGAAVEMAAKAVSQTQLNYNALNAPRYMRSVMGSKQLARIIMQFRKYQQGMLWLVASNIKDAIGGSAEDRRVAQRFLAGLFTTTGVMAGSLGLPLVGSVGMLANVLAGVFGDADDPFDFEEWVRNFYHEALGKELGDVASKGALMALGLDMSKRVGMADLANPIPFARAGNNGRETVGNVLSAVAGAPAGTIADTIDGIAALAGGDVVKAIEKATPLKLAHDMARTYRYGTDGMTDSKGNVVLPPDSFSPWDLALRASGFTPEKESTYFEANAAMQQAKQAAKDVRNTLLRDYAKAVISGEDTSDVSDKIAAFNERHPDKGVRIDHSTKLKSVQNLRRMASERNEAGLRTDRTSKPFLDRAAFATD